MQFEFHIYRATDGGEFLQIEYAQTVGDSAARARAGRLAKRHNGPVDLAIAGGAEWSERYITTAMPSEFHTVGYRFERLDG